MFKGVGRSSACIFLVTALSLISEVLDVLYAWYTYSACVYEMKFIHSWVHLFTIMDTFILDCYLINFGRKPFLSRMQDLQAAFLLCWEIMSNADHPAPPQLFPNSHQALSKQPPSCWLDNGYDIIHVKVIFSKMHIPLPPLNKMFYKGWEVDNPSHSLSPVG